jgi:hypothetical protein
VQRLKWLDVGGSPWLDSLLVESATGSDFIRSNPLAPIFIAAPLQCGEATITD